MLSQRLRMNAQLFLRDNEKNKLWLIFLRKQTCGRFCYFPQNFFFSEQKTVFSNLKLDEFFFLRKHRVTKKRIDYPFCVVYLLFISNFLTLTVLVQMHTIG